MHRLVLAAALAAAACASAASLAYVKSRPARCEVWSGDSATWRGACLFYPEGGGSFSIAALKGRFPNGASTISVTVLRGGAAEVRGLTRDGINSRWGGASRSRKDPACWEGNDFQVCAR
jgi:hypothetical protein